MTKGKSFHIHAPVTGKAPRPTVESLTAGTETIGGTGPPVFCPFSYKREAKS